MWRGLCGVVVTVVAVAVAASPSAAEVTGAHDNLRTGWYPDEPALAPSQITIPSRFKEAFDNKTLKGQIYAQPLVANGTLLVVTEEDYAYGVDPVTGAVRWERHFGEAVKAGAESSGETIKCPDLEPRVGITGTPVIDTEHNAAYFVDNRYISGSSGEIAWYMEGVKLDNGEELPSFPVKIEGEAQNLPGAKFVPVKELQRPALLLMNGVVYAGFGSHCDNTPYQGWIVGVQASAPPESRATNLWATTSAHGAAVWQSGGGLVSDGAGQILFSTGNSTATPGEFDPPVGSGQPPEPEGKFGESVVRVQTQAGGGLATTDYFSPFNNAELDGPADLDLGSSAPVGLPSGYFGNKEVPHLLVQGGKAGKLYLLNRDKLGGRGEGKNNVVYEYPTKFEKMYGAAAIWSGEGGYVDLISDGQPLHFFKYGEPSGKPSLVSETHSSATFAFGSGSPIVTSNGAASNTGVLWITRCPASACSASPGELEAYNPAGGAKALWKAPVGLATKFSRPGVSNGHIYVGNHEGHLIAFSGPSMTASTESLELAAPVGGQASREVTLTSTGSQDKVEGATPPAAPFEVSGIPAPTTKLEPGQAVKVLVTFKPTARGPVSGQFSVRTEAGEIKIVLSGQGEESATERAEREARERAEREAKEKAEREAKEKAALVTPLGPGLTIEPLLTLTKLKVKAKASRLSARRRKLVVSYVLSAAGKVEVVINRRATSHRCRPGVHTCSRWVATRLKLKVTGHAGENVLSVNLGALPKGLYQLAATPLNRSGRAGIKRTLEFRTVH